MATRPIKWINTGTTYCYVHSDFGSDLQGDGTMAKPYRTLQKAYSATNKSICCIGRFTGDMNASGYINRTIMATIMAVLFLTATTNILFGGGLCII